ncbi:FAD/NAD-P-binding domain-containing protein [Pterulicium gracile]|uniref:Kynurenine 3-monooxygenase n=1 Tax=Pterulicium gracile TaxID=1884261 RepID=A0A5C3R045_9AGAR|nr:FAD/NAD-P-binding domain-containing protein [Pterula gracilis]
MTTPTRTRKALVVGAGPVGCLASIVLAKIGWDVTLIEGRPDPRLPSSKAAAQQRSINLAISARGIAALEAVDPRLATQFLNEAIPMRGRMIHTPAGKLDSQQYDMDGQCINSIDRGLLNDCLLNETGNYSNIELAFQHKIESINFDARTARARNTSRGVDVDFDFDLCVGADGSYSVVRRQLMRVVRMDFSQEYISHEYIELKMAPGRDAQGRPVFAMDPNHLHIWPRHTFMLIALPNQDQSFTCTLFAPSLDFDQLREPRAFTTWFREQFEDAFHLIGEENLVKSVLDNPRCSLICTKSKPYHYKDRAILLGDSAHSMVPFYGQGMNCGLEDVRIFDVLLRQERVEATVPISPQTQTIPPKAGADIDNRLARVLDYYSTNRHEDLVAICELAMENYVEMRHDVTTPLYLLRKAIDNVLYSFTARSTLNSSAVPRLANVPFLTTSPKGWLPLYTMITFRPDISYATARRKYMKQMRVYKFAGSLGVLVVSLFAAWALSVLV